MKKSLLSIVESFWAFPGMIVDILVTIIFFVVWNYGFLEEGNFLRNHHYIFTRETILFSMLIPSTIYVLSWGIFTFFVSCVFLPIPVFLGKILNSKIFSASVCYGPMYVFMKFIISIFIGIIIEMSPLIIFSLTFREEMKISKKVIRKVEGRLTKDARRKKWSLLRVDVIRTMSNGQLGGFSPEYYARYVCPY
jgi:hypothetical protein